MREDRFIGIEFEVFCLEVLLRVSGNAYENEIVTLLTCAVASGKFNTESGSLRNSGRKVGETRI